MDLTVAAVPFYFGSMGAEYRYLKAHADERGPTAADYERKDTIASLTMGTASLLVPLVVPKLVRSITPGKGKDGKKLVAAAIGAAAVTTVADVVSRRRQRARAAESAGAAGAVGAAGAEAAAPERDWLDRVASAGAVATVVAGGVALTTTLTSRTTADKLWDKRLVRDLGTGPLAVGAAIVGWDFIYYWNHRFMHEARYMWAIHVVHHSSEHYNLSTALRQTTTDVFGTFVPYGLLSLFGIRPELVQTARGVNLLYQYWVHTDTIKKIGRLEETMNSPSHHRVHHGSNRQYLDRNHGGIFIIWDRLFGTFEREQDPVVYGLTKNINTFDPGRIIFHEHAEMLRDVAGSTTWRERLSYVLRGPGWAYARRAEREAQAEAPALVGATA